METAVQTVEYLTEWYWGLPMLVVLAGAGYAAYRFLPVFRSKVDEARENVEQDVNERL